MQLDSIEVTHFRNLSGKVFWGPHLNIIVGSNGQGKTNWLEAIYLLARSKSFRTQRLQESIAFGHSLATVSGIVSTGAAIKRELQVALDANTKSLFVNGKREPVARYLTHFQVFSFTADDLEVVRGNPEARRRFVDRGVASLIPGYLKTLSDYTRVIKQKNKLLQSANENEFSLDRTQDLLAPWNDQLVQLGSEIYHARVDYIHRLNATLEKQLFDQREVITRYVSSLEGKGDLTDYKTVLGERLAFRLNAELASGHSLLGRIGTT